MKKIFGFILLLGAVVCFTACSDDTDELPACHEDKIEEFRAVACPGSGDLTTWEFRNRLVYCYATGTCISDAYAEIYDEDCNLLCTLGGIGGLSLCEGVDWDSNAVRQGTVLIF